jgi:hypothetical protein
MTGNTKRLNISRVSMPPIAGAAMRWVTSAPVPVAHIMGIKPTMLASEVIATGRTRMAVAVSLAALISSPVKGDILYGNRIDANETGGFISFHLIVGIHRHIIHAHRIFCRNG